MDRAFGRAAGTALGLIIAMGGAAQAKQALLVGPSPAAQLGEAANAMAALTTSLVRGEPGRAGAGSVDVASRNGTLRMTGLFEGLAPSEVSFSSQGMGDVVLTPWVELSALSSEDTLRRYQAQVLELGVDAALANGLTIGAAVALVRADTESLSAFSDQTGEGEGTILTLSALYEAGGWTADAALRVSRMEYSQVFSGTPGTAEGEGTTFRASISRAFELGNGATLSPTVVLVSGREEVTGTGGGLAAAGTREVTFTETSIGAVYSHDLGGGTASFGLFADTLDVSGDTGTVLIGVDRAGSSARIEVGFDAALSDMVDLSAGLSYGGLGSDMEVIQGALGLSIRF